MKCIFCDLEIVIIENDLYLAYYDKFPVSDGHILIIPKRHAENYFDLTKEELDSINELLHKCKAILDENLDQMATILGLTVEKQ